MDICGDNRFEIMAKAKADLLECTNIETDESEMAVIDNILFRCWQMGWLDRYDRKTEPIPHDDYVETENDHLEARCLNCNNAKACKENHWEGCRYEPQTETKWLQKEGEF